MERRHFLGIAAGTGSLGGCSSLQNVGNQSPGPGNSPTRNVNDDPETSDRRTDSPEVEPRRAVALGEIETPPDSVPVTVGVRLREGEITGDQVGRLEVGFVTTDATTVRTGSDPPMGRTLSDDETPGLVLLTPSSADHVERVDDSMWKPDRPEDREWSFDASYYEADLPANSILSGELEIWADHRYDGYFDPGAYRFTHTFRADDVPVEWAFTLEVSGPV